MKEKGLFLIGTALLLYSQNHGIIVWLGRGNPAGKRSVCVFPAGRLLSVSRGREDSLINLRGPRGLVTATWNVRQNREKTPGNTGKVPPRNRRAEAYLDRFYHVEHPAQQQRFWICGIPERKKRARRKMRKFDSFHSAF